MYESFFGFREEPFKITPNPRYFYFSKKHKEAILCLQYGVMRRKGFIAITGEIGSGKTTLCRHFLSRLDEKTRYALIFNPCLSESQILKTIADDFGIEDKIKSKKDCFDAINRFLLEQYSKGNNVLLIIDEAQSLDIKVLEQIRLLSNLETESEKLIQIIFFAQPEFRDILRKPSMEQLRQRIAMRYHLEPMTAQEVQDYILYRIGLAGGKRDCIVITPKALGLIVEYTKGIPRLINVLMDKVLMAAYVHSTNQVTYPIVIQAIYEVEGKEPEIFAGEKFLDKDFAENL